MKNKLKNIAFATALFLAANTAQAQLKVGTNPTTIGATKNFEVEATGSQKVSINATDGRTYVENTPTAVVTDNVVMKYTDGELRQMTIAKLLGQLDTDGDGIVDEVVPDKDGDGVLNGADNCPVQYGCLPAGCPSACTSAVITESRKGTFYGVSTSDSPGIYSTYSILTSTELSQLSDNNTNTYISTLEDNLGVFLIDLGSPKVVTSVDVAPGNGLGFTSIGGISGFHPANVRVHGSYDGITWFSCSNATVPSTFETTVSATSISVFLNGTPYRYYALMTNFCYSCNIYISELKFNL